MVVWRFMRAALALLLLSSCTVSVPLEGKACAASEPRCVAGYVCVDGVCVTPGSVDGGSDAGLPDGGTPDGGTPDAGTPDAGTPDGGASDGGPSDAGCPLDVDPAQNACAGTTWYLSPTGLDTNDGRSPASPRLTVPPGLMRGDVLHLLGGTYTQGLAIARSMAGTAACPLLVEGEPDGGTVMRATVEFEGSYVVFRHLVFNALDADAITVTSTASRATFQYLTFRTQPPNQLFPVDLHLYGDCTDCVVRECVFESSAGVAPVHSSGDRFVFRGNRVTVREGAGMSIGGVDAVIEGNDFSGVFNDEAWLDFTGATGARLSRNVFHDLAAGYPDKFLVRGPVRITHNTFANITDNAIPLVTLATRFDDNLVTDALWVVGAPAPDAGDFNVFDPSVTRPYADWDGGALPGTDRIAQVRFDGATWVPSAGSAAIDSANPADAVPPGGGARADVGAVERGATALPDGRYCLLDGGF
jgi:hypothetical protein